MPVSASGLLLTAGGGVLLWSGIKGKSVTGVFRQLIGGDSPSGAANTNAISGVTSPAATSTTTSSGSSSGGTSPGSVTASVTGAGNYVTIAKYLTANGYSPAAAAGVVACIAGESGGDPEAVGTGGAGLIGWTPPSSMQQYGGTCRAAGIGNNSDSVDLANQMKAIINYNNANGPVSQLKSQTNPIAAADMYSQLFERPAVTDSDVRSSVATSTYTALGG